MNESITHASAFKVVDDQLRPKKRDSKYKDLREGRTVFIPRAGSAREVALRLNRIASAAHANGFRMRRWMYVLDGEAGHVVWWIRSPEDDEAPDG